MIAEELHLPPVKIHCSVLAGDAIKSAIADFTQRSSAAKRAVAARPRTRRPPRRQRSKRRRVR